MALSLSPLSILFTSAFLLVVIISSKGQNPCDGIPTFGTEKVIVTLDPISGIPDKDIPFDRHFLLKRVYPKGTEITGVYVEPVLGGEIVSHKDTRKYIHDFFNKTRQIPDLHNEPLSVSRNTIKVEENEFTEVSAIIPALDPNRSYKFFYVRKPTSIEIESYYNLFFYFSESDTAKAEALFMKIFDEKQKNGDEFLPALPDIKKFYFDKLLNLIFQEIKMERSPMKKAELKAKIIQIMDTQTLTAQRGEVTMFVAGEAKKVSTEAGLFLTRTQYVITPDMGVVYYGFNKNFSGVTPYVGICLNFRSYDPDVPMKKINCRLSKLDRLSINLGYAFGSVAKAGYRDDLFVGGRSMLLGGAYRLTNALKVNVGALGYVRLSDNTLLETKSIRVRPYAGISIDLRVREALKDIGEFFKGAILPTAKL